MSNHFGHIMFKSYTWQTHINEHLVITPCQQTSDIIIFTRFELEMQEKRAKLDLLANSTQGYTCIYITEQTLNYKRI